MSDKKPYPNLKDYKRHKRSYQIGKNIRLSQKNLEQADLNGLIRLANWLGVLPDKKDKFDSEWIQKIRCAIARKEKRLFGLPNQGREEEKKMSKVKLIKKLRVLTNAPMGDCLTALGESNDDLDKAIDWLKVKNLNAGGKIVEELTEGRIECFITQSSTITLVQVNCQTDFGARSELVENCLGDVSMASQTGTKEFSTFERDLAYKLGEAVKIKIHVEPFDTNEYVASYIHPNKKIGAIVKFNAMPFNDPKFVSSGVDDYDQNLCMQVAATNVLSISPEDLPADDVARQKAIFEEQVKLLKKPEAASAKILEGKMNKWYSEVCLMKQECVWLPKVSVEKYLKKQEEICGHPIVVKKFVKFSI